MSGFLALTTALRTRPALRVRLQPYPRLPQPRFVDATHTHIATGMPTSSVSRFPAGMSARESSPFSSTMPPPTTAAIVVFAAAAASPGSPPLSVLLSAAAAAAVAADVVMAIPPSPVEAIVGRCGGGDEAVVGFAGRGVVLLRTASCTFLAFSTNVQTPALYERDDRPSPSAGLLANTLRTGATRKREGAPYDSNLQQSTTNSCLRPKSLFETRTWFVGPPVGHVERREHNSIRLFDEKW